MSISVGQKLPEVSFTVMTSEGPASRSVAELFAGKRVALFAVPGAYTPTCHAKHMPSFVQAAGQLAAKGVDAIFCTSVNDVFVLSAWAEATGAKAAGITMLADGSAQFAKAVGLDIDLTARGLGVRSRRYSMLVEDGVVKVLNIEESPGQAVCSTGEVLVDQI